MRHLSFWNVRGDFLERNSYASRCHMSLFPSTKMPILCSKRPKTRVPKAKKAQKPRFCARKARKQGFRRQKKHKNLDFVLERLENGGLGGKKSTKTSILCSKGPKTGVPDPKSAQKCQFCARNAGKWGFRRPKKHKNPDFVLEKPENGGHRGQKRTKMPFLCSGEGMEFRFCLF